MFSINPYLNELFKNYTILKEYKKYDDDYVYEMFDVWKDMELKKDCEYYIKFLLERDNNEYCN